LTLLGTAAAQETEEWEFEEPQSPEGRLIADPGERRLARYQELQNEWSQQARFGQADETEPAPKRPSQETVSYSLLRAPKGAKKAYQRAVEELKKKKPSINKVADDLNKAVREYPEMAPAWELLGWVWIFRDNRAEAWKMFLQSVEADSRYQSGYIALAHTALDDGQWQEAVRWSERAVEINPLTSRAHFYWAVASFQMNDLETAAREAQKALEAPEPFLPAHSHQILGAVHHRRNDLIAAAEKYRIFLKAEPRHPLSAQLAKNVADWEAAGVIPVRRYDRR
jgi:tetratricopeptide (TPR) repeat protein